jgi:hypothetical protein
MVDGQNPLGSNCGHRPYYPGILRNRIVAGRYMAMPK